MKMILKKEKTVKNEKNILKEELLTERTYKIGKYFAYEQIVTLNEEMTYYNVNIRTIEKNYPTIYTKDSIDDLKIEDIRIQTTSYGALGVEEIKDMIKKYNHAVKVVEVLKEYFQLN